MGRECRRLRLPRFSVTCVEDLVYCGCLAKAREKKREDTKTYRIGTRSEPPSLTENNIVFQKDWLDKKLDFDMAWCMTANHINDDEIEMPFFGSWTVFNSMVADKCTIQSNLDYFPVIPYPPNESVHKDYPELFIDVKSDLEIDDIFCHSDQDVFYKITQIMWKEGDKYKGIINIMDSFHIFLVTLNFLYRKYGLLGLREWWVKTRIMADGSTNKVLEGRHISKLLKLLFASNVNHWREIFNCIY